MSGHVLARTARRQLISMLCLTFSTGVVDAVGYLGLDRVFAGNMTGNVVVMGMAVSGADDLPVLGPLLALAGFMIGATIGGRVLRRSTLTWDRRTTGLLTGVAAVLALLTVTALAAERPGGALRFAVTGLLAVAMGIQAATARRVAIKDVTTVVVTSTITGLAADSPLGAAVPGHLARRASAVLFMILGAAAGAALLQWHLAASLALAAIAAAGALVVGSPRAHRGNLHVNTTGIPSAS